MAKSLQKGAEVAWENLSKEQREAMQEAKLLEVKWFAQACEHFAGSVPSRLMRTRWVLVLAVEGDPSVKCKAHRSSWLHRSGPQLLDVLKP